MAKPLRCIIFLNGLKAAAIREYEAANKTGMDIPACIIKFAKHYREIYSSNDEAFLRGMAGCCFCRFLRR